MSLDRERTFEVDNGIVIIDPSNGTSATITGGVNSPLGLDFPAGSVYVQKNTNESVLWEKFGAGVNDWQIYKGSNISLDPTGNNFTATDVQSFAEEITNAKVQEEFFFSRSGGTSQNTFLRRSGDAPSNRSGFLLSRSNSIITRIDCTSRDVETYDVEIYEHEGDSSNLTLLTTVSVTSEESQSFLVNVAVTTGRQLAVRIGNTSTGNVRDPGVKVYIDGDRQ